MNKAMPRSTGPTRTGIDAAAALIDSIMESCADEYIGWVFE
jgi:hypothetical protein